jgi:hypothetical protein
MGMGSLPGGTMKSLFRSTSTSLVVMSVGIIFRVTQFVNTFLKTRHLVLRGKWIVTHIYHQFLNRRRKNNFKVANCKKRFSWYPRVKYWQQSRSSWKNYRPRFGCH